MRDGQVVLEPIGEGTVGFLRTLLDDNGLPTADVASNPDWFYVGYVDGDPIGGGGIEAYGPNGLLRSVVVEESVRGRDYGTALAESLEAAASRGGVENLYLLTTTAERFFEARGYRKTARAEVPCAIRRTSEFQSLCPESATCMGKSL